MPGAPTPAIIKLSVKRNSKRKENNIMKTHICSDFNEFADMVCAQENNIDRDIMKKFGEFNGVMPHATMKHNVCGYPFYDLGHQISVEQIGDKYNLSLNNKNGVVVELPNVGDSTFSESLKILYAKIPQPKKCCGKCQCK